MKYPAPILSLENSSNVLAQLHTALLPKLGVMKTFSVAMRSVLAYLGELNLQSLEIELIAQVTHHLVSLHEAEIPTKLLLRLIREYH